MRESNEIESLFSHHTHFILFYAFFEDNIYHTFGAPFSIQPSTICFKTFYDEGVIALRDMPLQHYGYRLIVQC